MKVFIIDKDRIIKYILPSNMEDSFLIDYKNSTIKDDAFISFEGIDNEWYLTSNGTFNIIDNNGAIIDKAKALLYEKYTLKLSSTGTAIELYFFPKNEQLFKLSLNNLTNLYIGKSDNCHFCYKHEDVSEIQAEIKFMKDMWYISTLKSEKYKIFVNNFKIIAEKIKPGDIIFVSGLKIVWMKKFVLVNNPKNLLKVTGLTLLNETEVLEELLPVEEEDRHVDLYKKEDYFVHTPLIRESVSEEEILIDPPPSGEKESDAPFIVTIGSSIVMMSSSMVMLYNTGYGFASGRAIWSLIPQMLMCVAMITGSIIIPKISKNYYKKKKAEQEQLRHTKYWKYLEKKERQLELIVKNHVQIQNDTYPDIKNCSIILRNRNRNFWGREVTDEQFLILRLGTGKRRPNIVINAPERHFSLDDDDLLGEAYRIVDRYREVDNMPISISLVEHNVTSLICPHKNKDSFVNELIYQMTILHSSLDLKIVIITNSENEHRWDFAKIIPHVFSEEKNIRFFAVDENEAKTISNYLEEELKTRKEDLANIKSADTKNPFKSFSPYYLIITDDYKNKKNIHIIDTILKENENYGFSLFVIENTIKQVPTSSKAFIELGALDGAIIERHTGLNSQKLFKLNENEKIDMKEFSVSLSQTPVMAKEGASILPTMITFLEMFGVSKIEHLNILNRWHTNNPVNSLDSIIGVHTNGDKFKLDLHEKFHGPHGLIAGATGSGKSEFIITYILSMIVNYHPYEVQFVLVDYKGGGLAGAFENNETGVRIPHLAGTITNLDASEINRTMVSVTSELQRRQRAFNEVRETLNEGTIDIYKYQKLYREGVVKEPMSHLFIICDEFAELKQQRPEFMEQLISTSRIGRALGVHLILATQKPSGIVNEQIWANSKFKICMKVQERSDSQEMLKRPDAASIKETGRFYLLVGYNDFFDIGQSAWSGAKYIPSDRIVIKTDESVNFIDNVGNSVKTTRSAIAKEQVEVDYGDQLNNIVKYIYNLGLRENVVTKKMWLDTIPNIIYVNNLKQKYSFAPVQYNINPVIGEYDSPVNQSQGLLNIDLNKGNLAIFGAVGSGKDNLLMTMIHSIIVEHSPEEVNMYILDCGAETLSIFNGIPHVGDVLTINDSYKIIDLFNYLNDEMERRKLLFTEYGGNYNDYLENSSEKLPLIVTVINNYDSFIETYPKQVEMLNILFRDTSKYGIVFILSSIATNTLRSRTLQYFNNKICLQIPDDNEYSAIIGCKRGLKPASVFGRGIVSIFDTGLEFQTAIFIDKKNQVNYIRQLREELNSKYTIKAPKIPTVPEVVTYSLFSSDTIKINSIPLGYSMDNKRQTFYDFTKEQVNIISTSGMDEKKMSFINTIIDSLKSIPDVSLNIIDLVNAYSKQNEDVKLYNEDFDTAIVEMNNNIIKTKDSNIKNFYVILGMGNIIKKSSQDAHGILSKLFMNLKEYKNTFFIIIDVNVNLRNIMIEEWYMKNVDTSNGIWLGINIGNQSTFNVPELTMEDRALDYPYMGFIVSKGKHKAIRYVIEKEEVSEE